MRVLYICGRSGIGGAETFVRHTAKYHRNSKIVPFYYCFSEGPLVDSILAAGREVRVAGIRPRLSRPLSVLDTIFTIKRLVKEWNIDLIHSTMSYAALFGGPAARLASIPHVWFQHGPVSNWMDQMVGLAWTDGVIFNSRFTLEQQYKIEFWRTKMEQPVYPHSKVVYLGYEPEADLLPQRTGLDPFVVGLFCRLQEWKGPLLFAQAIAKVKKLTNKNVMGVIFGDRDYSKQGRILYDELVKYTADLEGSLVLREGIPSPKKEMSRCHCVVNASIQPEPYGLTLIEAMGVGAVPIGPNRAGPLESIQHEKTGLIYESSNPDSLAEAIVSLVENQDKYQRLAQSTKAYAERNMQANSAVWQLEDYYLSI